MRPISLACWALIAIFLDGLLSASHCQADAVQIRLKDGRILQGKIAPTAGIADPLVRNSGADAPPRASPILIIDDELRRTFVPKAHFAGEIDQAPEPLIKIEPWQSVARAGVRMRSVGLSLQITPFDEFGRRIYKMQSPGGPLAVVQGITLLTPRYAKVEGLLGQPKTVVWDMRLATSSIPRDILKQILRQAVPQDNPESRLEIVRFWNQAERYSEAHQELEAIVQRYPEMADLKNEVRLLRQLGARRILKEIRLRRSSGQHEMAKMLLKDFPAEEVAGETLQQVREVIAEYEQLDQRLEQTRQSLKKMAESIDDPKHRALALTAIEEIQEELNYNNLDRMVAFRQLADDESLSVSQRSALAISGWIIGSDQAIENLAVAVSLVKVRDAVRDYLHETVASRRAEILASMESLEGATVPRVARILTHMKPPWIVPESAALGFDAFELTAPGETEEGDFRYQVQLPPEYDPYRRYPLLVVLNGAYNRPSSELNFWAGAPQLDDEGKPVGARLGQAMRHGYITMTVLWQKPQQIRYEYSSREHTAVLMCLRDAFRRFSVDTDRVYLTGHGSGGEAAWDLGVSHPDIWAGVMPFVSRFDKTISHYWENAEFVPFYFVTGELDQAQMSHNAPVLNKYLRKRFDTTVIEYLGRGHESFHDEILRLFDWMPRYTRKAPPKEFMCNTMRSGDNYFWWIECDDLAGTVHPANWPKKGARPVQVSGKQLSPNNLTAKTPSQRTTLWLSPDLVDFSKPIKIKLNRRKVASKPGDIRPSLSVLLEDTRTRADRHHPFWAKIQIP